MEKLFEKLETLQFEDNDESEKKLAIIKKKIFGIIKEVLVLPEEKLEQYNVQKNLKMEAYVLANSEKQIDLDNEDYGGFSIYSVSELAAPELRKVWVYIQHLMEKNIEFNFLLDHVEWGLNDDLQSGGFRIFTPKNSVQSKLMQDFIQVIENQFKIGLNIVSSTGDWDKNAPEENTLLDGVVRGPQKCCFTLEDSKNPEYEQWFDGLTILYPDMAYHTLYKEMRILILNEEVSLDTPIIWLYMALLNQDGAVVEKIYGQTQETWSKLDEDAQKLLAKKYLNSLTDSFQINELVVTNSEELTPNGISDEFLEVLKKTGLLKDMEVAMNAMEKEKYGIKGGKKFKK
jgi:hypothetical protein